MRQPDIYIASKGCLKGIMSCVTEVDNGIWEPARPIAHNAFSILWRWKLAFYVLIGKYDAFKWIEK